MYGCVRTNLRMTLPVWTGMYLRGCMYACMYVDVRMSMYVYMYMCMYACMYMYVCRRIYV